MFLSIAGVEMNGRRRGYDWSGRGNEWRRRGGKTGEGRRGDEDLHTAVKITLQSQLLQYIFLSPKKL